jgi:hypothetical protein
MGDQPEWLTCNGEDPRYSSCRYVVPVLDWKGCKELIRARGVSYTTQSEAREAPKGARKAFPEIAWEDLKVSQKEGPVDMIIGKGNLEWMPFPVREELYEQFTLMWMSLSSCYILKEHKWPRSQLSLGSSSNLTGVRSGGVFHAS